MAFRLQEWIHKYEVGAGRKLVMRLVGLLAMIALAIFYNLAAFQNMFSPEGMDAAQLARNISEGKGFTTDCIRPLSLHLIYQRATNVMAASERPTTTNALPSALEQTWIDRLQVRHPDLANPPLYPLLLAGALKLNPYGWPDVTSADPFSIYLPDLWIAMFNQLLLLLAAILVFNLARKLFDESVAWVSAVIFMGTELYWRFSISGLPTILLLVLFLLLMRLLLAVEAESRRGSPRSGRLVVGALGAGLLVGLCALTNYSFAILMIPLSVFVATLPMRGRMGFVFAALVGFLVLLSPWLKRNYDLSGTPLGTAGYAVFQETERFPGDQIQRSSQPDFREFSFLELRSKFVKNARRLLADDLLQLGGSWASAFFVVSLLIPFQNVPRQRLRTFLVLSLLTLALMQCVAATEAGPEASQAHSQDLLAVTGPVIFIFAVSLFFTVVDQGSVVATRARVTATGGFCLVLSTPLIMTLLPPHAPRVQYPPYFPPWIQEKASHMGREDWMMSDIPWAVAWYGDRPAVWLSRHYIDPYGTSHVNDFFQIHDHFKPLNALYLSTRILKEIHSESLWHWVGRINTEAPWEDYVREWESFALIGIYLKNEVPREFPLKGAPLGIFPELFLTDSEHMNEKLIQSP